MKRLIALLALLLLPVWAQGAYAQVVINFSTDNVAAQFGPGGTGTVFAGGGTICSWCQHGYPLSTPGASLNPSAQFVYDFVGGAIDCNFEFTCLLSDDYIHALRDITFPTNGQDFAVRVPAEEVGVRGVQLLPGGEQRPFAFGGAGGKLVLSFGFLPASVGHPSHYEFGQGTFTTEVAEPGPLVLMAAGLAGLAVTVLRRRSRAT